MPTRRILIVSDDTAATAELAAHLSALGYDVADVARSAIDAIDRVVHVKPDLVLLDIALRYTVNDANAAEAIRHRGAVPVVLIARATDDATMRRTGVTEPYGYVAMPFTERELYLVIELALARHDAARQVREMEERFFDVSIDMLCFLDYSGYFRQLNPAWERTLGFTREELMSRPFIEFVHPDDRERTLAQNAVVRGGGQALGFENRYRCKDGSYRWFLWNATPGAPERVIYGVARDMTARKQAEEDRERLVRELRAALAEVRTLQEILPICSYCRKVRDDENYWQSVESYISAHTKTRFSHSICPSCYETVVEPQFQGTDDS